MTCLLARLAAMERSFDLSKEARRRPGHPAAKNEKPGAQPVETTASERNFAQPRKNAR
jgi:hypothetical protein